MPRRSLLDHFAELPDPRIDRTKKHRLDDILVIALCALLCGATTFEEVEEFAECRRDWLEDFLTLEHGIPSHDTIYRVFCALDAAVFADCFGRWLADWGQTLGLKHVALDGKSLRGAGGNTFSGCVHLVSAWAPEHGLILGQEAVGERSNEATAIPAILEALHLKGALVTIDAAGCQREVVGAIRAKGGDYLVAVKKNQPTLHGNRHDDGKRDRHRKGKHRSTAPACGRGAAAGGQGCSRWTTTPGSGNCTATA